MVQKKKIVFITPGIEVGGAEKQLAALAKGVLQRNYDPIVIALSKSKRNQRLLDFDGLKVIEINSEISQKTEKYKKIMAAYP